MQERLTERLAGGPALPLAAVPSLPDDSRDGYVRLLRQRGLQAIAVDVTTPDVLSCGLHVARVVVPGLRCTAPAAFPFLGASPLTGSPWEGLGGGAICTLPLPHA
jgi:ribosomal protein S12 methylthiotransferase accessory factor